MLHVVSVWGKITFQALNKVWDNGTSLWCGCELKPFCFGSLWLENSLKNQWVDVGEELLQKIAHSEVILRGKSLRLIWMLKVFRNNVSETSSVNSVGFSLVLQTPMWRRMPTLLAKPFLKARLHSVSSSSYLTALKISSLLYNCSVTSSAFCMWVIWWGTAGIWVCL